MSRRTRRTGQRHWRAGVETCANCHPADSDPSQYTPEGEDVLPPNYAVDLGVASLTDPCNPGGVGEDFRGDPGGLDNDGDETIDSLDIDCAGPTPTPAPPTPATPTPSSATPTPATATPSPTPTVEPPRVRRFDQRNSSWSRETREERGPR